MVSTVQGGFMNAQDSYPADELLTIDQAAELLHIQPKSVQSAIRRGALPAGGTTATWPGSDQWLRRPDVEAYAVNRKTWKSKVPWPPGTTIH